MSGHWNTLTYSASVDTKSQEIYTILFSAIQLCSIINIEDMYDVSICHEKYYHLGHNAMCDFQQTTHHYTPEDGTLQHTG
jgi:hypothetical protein